MEKIPCPEPYKPSEVIIIILDIFRVNRLVVYSKESIVNTNRLNCVDFTYKTWKDHRYGILTTA